MFLRQGLILEACEGSYRGWYIRPLYRSKTNSSLFSPSSWPAQALRLSEEVEGLRARAAEAAALETALAVARTEIESARRGRDELLARADAQAAELRR